MKKKIFVGLICVAMLVISVGCAGNQSHKNASEGNESQEELVSLFSLPVDSSSMTPNFETYAYDSEGRHHGNCYFLEPKASSAPKEDAAYVTWKLSGKYSEYAQIIGTLYIGALSQESADQDTGYWLEFCDEEGQSIYTTDRLTYDTPSVSVKFPVFEVEYLTMYAYYDDPTSENSKLFVDKIIADDIFIS